MKERWFLNGTKSVTVFRPVISDGALAFAYAAYLYLWVKKQPVRNATIADVSALIKEGANTFMRREYLILAKFAGIIAVIIFILLPSPIWQGNILKNLSMAVAYLFGTAFSAIAGKIGIMVATHSTPGPRRAPERALSPPSSSVSGAAP